MAKPCFYHSQLQSCATSAVIELSSSESSHALQSRRLSKGSEIQLLDGQGCLAEAVITKVGRRSVSAVITKIEQVNAPEREVHCVIAMPKGDRQKTMIDMLTQLGVTSVSPLRCERAISIPKENQLEKLKRASIEACKQSKNPFVVEIGSVIDFNLAINDANFLVFADQFGKSWKKLSSILEDEHVDSSRVTVLVGPEGGFSETELAALANTDTFSLRIGQHILRTETAAITLATLFKS